MPATLYEQMAQDLDGLRAGLRQLEGVVVAWCEEQTRKQKAAARRQSEQEQAEIWDEYFRKMEARGRVVKSASGGRGYIRKVMI